MTRVGAFFVSAYIGKLPTLTLTCFFLAAC